MGKKTRIGTNGGGIGDGQFEVVQVNDASIKFFNNLPEIMKAVAVADLLGLSIKTIYDWRYKQKTRNIPNNLFIKINRLLYLRTAVLREWITSQNQYLV
jgi:hypothetical protein